MKEAQCTDTIFMVRPANFGYNSETAENNAFQNAETNLTANEIKDLARSEFDNMVKCLRELGVRVYVFEDTLTPAKTDAVFPNNWFSSHLEGKIFLYPMFSPNRRNERREDIITNLAKEYEFQVDRELLKFESEEKYLEGTGSMILDRPNKIIYACYSIRTNPEVLRAYGDKIGYKVVGFNATDSDGIPYYHTNVIMALGEHIATICTVSIEDLDQRKALCASLSNSGKIIVHLSREQILAFAGNMLEVKGDDDKNLLVMSSAAHKSLQEEQLNIINLYNKIVHLPLGTIEQFGGGSARCMIAEIFLPKK